LPGGPAIVVLDEFPWLAQSSPSLEGALQAVWDRVFEAKPVLFVLIGSDLTMMESLTRYDRPLFGRAKEYVVNPFTVADTAAMIGVDDSSVAIDAQLVTGGYPRLCLEWRGAPDAMSFVGEQLSDENSDLVVVGRTVLAAEFPTEIQARQVLGAIGAGERTNKAIASRAGLQAAPLARSLHLLREGKRVVAADLPVSTHPAREPPLPGGRSLPAVLVAFHRAGLTRHRPRPVRSRPGTGARRVGRVPWPRRGTAGTRRTGRSGRQRSTAGGTAAVGGYWTRAGSVEVDIVGVDQ